MTAPRLFSAPPRYVQGPGALDSLPELAAPHGGRPVVVTDPYVRDLLGDRVVAGLRAAGMEPLLVTLPGEITYAAVDQLVDDCAGPDRTLVIGLGGGKSLDAAKALSARLGVPVLTVPTVASNDSPTSSLIAMYDDGHAMVAVDRIASNPVAVLVDTELVAQSPVAFLRAGIGDAISKKLEADGCRAGTGVTPLGSRPLIVAGAIADACWATLHAHAARALEDCARGEVTDDLEATVEAVVLLSGLAFENGGLSLAHSLTRGLMRDPGARSQPHGHHVAWGALVQAAAEGRSDVEILELVAFLRSTGLPVRAADLGIAEPLEPALREIARWTMTAPHLSNLAVAVESDDVVAAALRVEALAARH